MEVYNLRYSEKQDLAFSIKNLDFHKFMEIEGSMTRIEIAEELGISLGEVKKLKEKINRA